MDAGGFVDQVQLLSETIGYSEMVMSLKEGRERTGPNGKGRPCLKRAISTRSSLASVYPKV